MVVRHWMQDSAVLEHSMPMSLEHALPVDCMMCGLRLQHGADCAYAQGSMGWPSSRSLRARLCTEIPALNDSVDIMFPPRRDTSSIWLFL